MCSLIAVEITQISSFIGCFEVPFHFIGSQFLNCKLLLMNFVDDEETDIWN